MREIIKFNFHCDKCKDEETLEGDNLETMPRNKLIDGWKRIKGKDYCPKCLKLVTGKDVTRFPSGFIVHTPSGPLYACLEHSRQVTALYGALGCHVVVQQTNDKVACVNCVNEAKDKEREAQNG